MRLTSNDVAAEAGITYRQLDYWTKRGYVQTRNHATGQGSVREYDDAELQVAIDISRLIRVGFTLDVASQIARPLNRHQPINLGEHFTLTYSPPIREDDAA